MKDYPEWICVDCALGHGGKMESNHVAPWHIASCDVCDVLRVVTEPKHFGYPDFGVFKSVPNRLKTTEDS